MTSLGELLYALVETPPADAGEAYSIVAGGSLFELYGMDGHDDCDLSVYCRNPLHPGPCKGWKKHLGATAPGVLAALEKVRHEKLAASRAKRAAAKSEAEKIVHGKLGHGSHPLHQKQLTAKHVHQILGNDENKAVSKASKVILNKTEIKRYAKLKAAQIAANGGAWAGVKDRELFSKNLEAQIANALTLDNQESSTHHLHDLLADHADSLAGQFAARELPKCAKGDHDCDGIAFEALKNHLSTSVYRGLTSGNMDQANEQAATVKSFEGDPAKIRAWLESEGVDLKGGGVEAEVTPPEAKPAKVGAPVYTTLKAAGLKPGSKVYLHAVSHDGKKYVASTSDAKGANTHSVLVTVDAPAGGKAVFHDDSTGEKITGGSAAKKYFLTEAEGHALAKPEPAAPKSKPGAETKAKEKSNPLAVLTTEQLINGVKMKGTTSPGGKVLVAELAKRGLDPDGNPLGSAPSAPTLSEKAKYAHDLANGKVTAGTLGTLGAYKSLTKEEFDSFDQPTKDKITKWLGDLSEKTNNQGLINAVAVVNKKLGIGEEPASEPPFNILANTADIGSNTSVMLSLQSHPELYRGLSAEHKTKIADALNAKYLLGTPDEVALAKELASKHNIDIGQNQDVPLSNVDKNPPASEWVQPGSLDNWYTTEQMAEIVKQAHTPMTDEETAGWVDKLGHLPKGQWDTLSKGKQDMILYGLGSEHEMAMGQGDLAWADHVNDIHKQLTGHEIDPAPNLSAVPTETPANATSVGNPIEAALDLGVSDGEMLNLLQAYPDAYKELPDYHKAKVKKTLQHVYGTGSAGESNMAAILAGKHGISLFDEGGEGGEVDPFDQPFGPVQHENVQKIIDAATGGKFVKATTKLPLYQELSDDDLASLTPEQKDILTKDLQHMSTKFKDPKKIAATAEILLKVHKSQGGGAGAGGSSHVETPGATELNKVSPAAAKLISGNVDKMMASVKKATGVDTTEGMAEAITAAITKMIGEGDDAKLLAAAKGPADAIAKHVTLNNDILGSHKAELAEALQHDLVTMLKSGNPNPDTPVLDAVDKWGTTKVLKANAAAKIIEALKNHPTQQGEAGHAVSDSVLGHELAKHAGEKSLPPVVDPSDYGSVSNWLGAHHLANELDALGITPDDIMGQAGPNLGTSVLQDVENQLKADYLAALFEGKTKPGGLAGKLSSIVSDAEKNADKSAKIEGWKLDSPAHNASKAGFLYDAFTDESIGKPSGAGGTATQAPAKVKKAVAEGVTGGGLTDGQKITLKQAYKSFGNTAYLKEATPEQNFDNLFAVASVYSGEEGMGSLTYGDVMDAIDEQMATELGVVNGKLLRKKITDWMQTPAGKNYVDSVSAAKSNLVTHLTGKLAELKEIAEWQKKNQLPKYPGPGNFDPNKPASDFRNLTVQDGYAEHQAELKKLGKKISGAQKQALVSYSGSGASYMNDWLRTGNSYGGINTIKEAHLVDEAMYPTPTDKHMIRRTGWEFVPPQFRSAEAIKGLIGGTFKDPAFMSTTYYETPGTYGRSLPVVLDMQIPKGTRGFHLDHWSVFKGTENEWLMAAGQTLQIMGVEVINDHHPALNPLGGKRVVVKVRVVNGDDE